MNLLPVKVEIMMAKRKRAIDNIVMVESELKVAEEMIDKYTKIRNDYHPTLKERITWALGKRQFSFFNTQGMREYYNEIIERNKVTRDACKLEISRLTDEANRLQFEIIKLGYSECQTKDLQELLTELIVDETD